MTETHQLLIVEDAVDSMGFITRCISASFPEARQHQASSVRMALDAVASVGKLDLAIVDLGLPDGSGLDVITALQVRHPDCAVVVYTQFDDDGSLFDALRRGATGYLLKSDPPERTQDALKALMAGEPQLSPRIALRMLREFHLSGQIGSQAARAREAAAERQQREQQQAVQQTQLTPRELETLTLTAKGLRLPELAQHLQVTRSTAATYLKRIYRKLAINSRAEATLEAARLGLVQINQDSRRRQ